MNRQQRRMAQRQGQSAPDDGVAVGDGDAFEEGPAAPVAVRTAPVVGRRTSPRQFLHEVNVERRKVSWPTRAETANYATVVFVALAVLMALIFGLDLGFTKLANFLFK